MVMQVTKGKKLMTIIGQPKVLAMAVKNKNATKRLTNLAERIAKQ
jgi:exodeoxyribonuclease V alpha subunit